MICNADRCPIAVEVFEGNRADPATVPAQVAKLKDRFGVARIAWVGDRGMITSARIEQDLKPNGMDWINSLRAPQIALLAQERGPFQPSLFDERNLFEVDSEHFPGGRLIVCRNPLLAEERARKRAELLAATETALDGLYVIRTSLPPDQLDPNAAVAAYKSLSRVERAFRSIKTVDLKVRPVFHYSTERVRAHVFLCMLAYYVDWHMRERLKPMLFDDEFIEEAQASRASAVAKTRRSDHAKDKDASKHADDGTPLHSFHTLVQDLGTLAYNITCTALNPKAKLILTTRPTPLQDKAFKLLGVNPARTQ